MSFKYLSEVSKTQCSAKVVAYSANEVGDRLITLELEYPRFIHSEIMTHRNFSRNAMSSRAVPVSKLLEQTMMNPAQPVEYGKNKAGMQSGGAYEELVEGYTPDAWWKLAAFSASRFAKSFSDANYHKQVANRLVEPFQRMKTIVSATEWDNFFNLRVDSAADPTMQELAECIKEAIELAKDNIEYLDPYNKWHLPYIRKEVSFSDVKYFSTDDVEVTLEEAKAISVSCCAQVSYRNIDGSFTKALDIYSKLGVGTEKLHASPLEHIACLMEDYDVDSLSESNFPETGLLATQSGYYWEKGITHTDRLGFFWSGNFKGFLQYRQVLC